MGQRDQSSPTTWEEMISQLHSGRSGNERAVHKPLLILMLLARAQRGESNEVYFNDIDRPLEEAVRRFGPSEKPGGSEMPFWHLKNDGFWVVEDEESIPRRAAGDRPTRTGLRKCNTKGFVPRPLWDQLTNCPELVDNLAHRLLVGYWLPEQYGAILEYFGLKSSKVRKTVDE